jgi:type IV secretion system protein VirD4
MKPNTAVGPGVRENKKKGHWLRLVWCVLSLVAGFVVATQLFAANVHFHPLLGSNAQHVYAPWSILVWAKEWYPQNPKAFGPPIGAGVGVTALGFMVAVIASTVRSRSLLATPYLHGSARWASQKDIDQAGLLKNDGVYVGSWVDPKDKAIHYLRHSGPEHVLCYAPTRSGKGVGLVIPTLLSWKESVVITDLKGELYALTAGWRREYANNKILRFEPAAGSGCVGFNPLEEIRLGSEHEVADAQNLALLIVDPDGKGLQDHWQKAAQPLLAGCILHLLYKAKVEKQPPPSLSNLDEALADPSRSIDEFWKEMLVYGHIKGKNHPTVGAAARDQIDRPSQEAGSVLSTTKTYLSLYRDPIIARNIKKSQFKIRDLMNHENPVSLYIITKPDDKARLTPLVRVVINMILRLLASQLEFEDGQPVATYRHRLLLMLDEFPSLGKLEIMQQSLAFIAGYGIKCYLICQDINQLQMYYGKEEQITSNSHIQLAFPPNRLETAEHLSKLTGQTTVVKEQVTTSGNRFGNLTGVSKTLHEVQRPLLTPDECQRMPGPKKDHNGMITEAGDMVVYCAGFPAIYGRQPLYFENETFKARAKIQPPKRSDALLQ